MRYLIAVAGLVVVIGGLAYVKFSQISSLIAMGEQMQAAGPPPETVNVAKAEQQVWEATLSSVGTITAVRGLSLSTEVPGTVTGLHFESGQSVKAGQVLAELDTSVERAQLASLQSRLDYAKLTANRSRTLEDAGVVGQAQVDGDEAQERTLSRDIGALRAQISRKTIRAPFAGKLGIRTVNLGQYLNPGSPVTTLESNESVYVDFALPQQRSPDVPLGTTVRVNVEGIDGPASDAVVSAVDPNVDPTSRTVKFRATVPNQDGHLRQGMFVKVVVVLPKAAAQVTVPATALVHASFGDSVFVVEEKRADGSVPAPTKEGQPVKVARQQFVRVGEARGDFVAIVDGVTAGQEVVMAGAFKLRNGSTVVIDPNAVVTPQLSPKPENH